MNNFYIEINRAAGCVTVYAYDSQKKKYIIPVKTFTVSCETVATLKSSFKITKEHTKL